MKKLLSLLGVLITIGCLQAYAEKSGVYLDFYKYGHEGKNTTVHRSPMQLPFYVFYDNETRQIEVVGNEEVEVQIFLCDENGNTLDYSPCINAVLNVPYNYGGLIILRIESEEWIATGKITV